MSRAGGGDDIERGDLEALVATRRELGAEYDAELVDAFADRVERAIEARTHGAVSRRDRLERQSGGAQIRQFVLGIGSLGVGIPITIVPMVAAENGLPAVIVAWLGIAAVNAAHASAVNGPRRHDR